jgi:hypothetical protein
MTSYQLEMIKTYSEEELQKELYKLDDSSYTVLSIYKEIMNNEKLKSIELYGSNNQFTYKQEYFYSAYGDRLTDLDKEIFKKFNG